MASRREAKLRKRIAQVNAEVDKLNKEIEETQKAHEANREIILQLRRENIERELRQWGITPVPAIDL